MSELWRLAPTRRREFDAAAVAYDRLRPRYPSEVFDLILEHMHAVEVPESAIDVGAGTGIASAPLSDRGVKVLAVEPAPQMAALARAKLGSEAEVVIGRLEEFECANPVGLVTAFNAWHWVDPAAGLEKAAYSLVPGGTLALVWTDVVQYGQPPFERRLAELGMPVERVFDQVTECVDHVDADDRFERTGVRRFQFERCLSAETFLAVRKTYGGSATAEHDSVVRQLIVDEFDGEVVKVEEAVTYLFRRK